MYVVHLVCSVHIPYSMRAQLSQSSALGASETTAGVSIRLFKFQLINLMKRGSGLQPMVESAGWICFLMERHRVRVVVTLRTCVAEICRRTEYITWRWVCVCVSSVRARVLLAENNVQSSTRCEINNHITYMRYESMHVRRV